MSNYSPDFPASFTRIDPLFHQHGIVVKVHDATTTDPEFLESSHSEGAALLDSLNTAVAAEVERLSKELPSALTYARLRDKVRAAEEVETVGKKEHADASEQMTQAVREDQDTAPHKKKMDAAYKKHSEARLLIGQLSGAVVNARKEYEEDFREGLTAFLEKQRGDVEKVLEDHKQALAREVVKEAVAVQHQEETLHRLEWWGQEYESDLRVGYRRPIPEPPSVRP